MAAAFALLASSCHDGGQRGVGTEPMAQIAVEKHAEILSLPIEVKAKRVTIQEGLPSNVVSDMQQDQKGFLWFSTHNGLARYDGNVVTTYLDNDSTGVSALIGRTKKALEDVTYKKLWVYSSSERLTCLNMVDGKEEKYCQEVEKLHFPNWKLVCDGMFWLWGAKDGAMLVDYRSGSFLTRRFAQAEIGSSRVPLIDSLDKDNVVLCTTDKVFLYSEGRLFCIAKGMRMSRTRPFHHKMLMVSEKGDVYVLRQGKLQRFSHVAYVDGEVATGDLLMGNRWILFTNRRSFSIDVRTGEVAECEGEWLIPNGRVLTDNKGRKWIYNKTGVLRLVRQDKLVPLILFPQQTTNYIDYERFHIVEDNHGLIWISTYGKGLFVFNQDLTQSQHFVADKLGESPVASNYLLGIIADRHDGVWVSSEYGGVSHIQVMDKGVERIYPNGEGNMDFSNVVRMVKKMNDGTVMVGTRAGSLYHYSADMSQVLGKSHFDSNVYGIVQMPNGETWIGTRGKGIYGAKGLDFKDRNVFCMASDAKHRMWIGTFGKGLSLVYPRKDGYGVKTFFADSVGLNEVRCMVIDKHGVLWCGTSGGLIRIPVDEFVKDASRYKTYVRDYEIRDVIVDRQGRLWLSASGDGLVQVEPGDGETEPKFYVFNTSNGLVNNLVQSVVDTPDGNLWISTQQGVTAWNARKKSFENYMFSRNPMGNVYNENSAVCLDDGRVVLGGNYGLTIIQPSRLSHVSGLTDVVFTSYPYSDEITLTYEQRSPNIHFSTLDYSDVRNVKYTYRLEGFDQAWSQPSSTPWAAYQKLPAGKYLLHVKACTSDGTWGKESTLVIRIKPPFYLTSWAIMIYVLLVLGVIILVVKFVHDKNVLRNRIRLEQELTRYKLVFFTNIAHEFRTPLTLMQGSLEKEKCIMKANRWQTELEKTIRVMDKSVQRMLRLIDQLLEFRKMQAGKLKLSLQETDAVMFVKGICRMFDDAAESKEIAYSFESSEPAHAMFLDQQMIDKVVFNLLSNAFKYTPAKGTISVSLSFTDVMTIRVADTGVGIPQEKREQLFSRFMQSSYTGESFGIGLHLTHELVRTHHGEITYQENEGGGSVFVVTIPLQKDCYEASDFLVKDSPILKADLTKERDGQEEKTTDAVPSAPSAPLNRRTILLIEDDNDVREFLLSELESCFDLKVASDGKAGIAMAKELDVDLIVSDVMMPGMNGFELTKRLKNSFETSHIPIILLTALSTDENVLEGTESGADAYITKPFSPQLLMARILQLLNQREILRQKFGKVPQEIRSAMLRNEQDSLFVKRLDSIVYSRLGEQDLSVDKVAGLLHLGRTIFYKKVRGTTGYTPNEYIRVIRLRKAAELLKEGEKNVSEVAYAVGFDNPYYFSKCFKEQFGMPPSQYRS
ncbi:hybrid sensor histidine kinase/response regulator transcription factor [Segatella copri]|uniref:hybrid sensor histidine kinase/response regulator transcription factor n=1 Tax=Segatella copri TaxID=165179 RepID=UPI00294AA978|nr:ATP-binding protein [Segatella copri]